MTPEDLAEGRRLLVPLTVFLWEHDDRLYLWVEKHGSALLDAAEERDRLRERADAAEAVLRSLASYFSAGGYNADIVDPAVFERKIRDGIGYLTAPLEAEVRRLREDVERLNRMIRETGQGQGAIDAYVAQCEEIDRLRDEVKRLSQRAKMPMPETLTPERVDEILAEMPRDCDCTRCVQIRKVDVIAADWKRLHESKRPDRESPSDLEAAVECALLDVAENVAKHVLQRTGEHDPNDPCFRADLRDAERMILDTLQDVLDRQRTLTVARLYARQSPTEADRERLRRIRGKAFAFSPENWADVAWLLEKVEGNLCKTSS